jgi:hypothetical protein
MKYLLDTMFWQILANIFVGLHFAKTMLISLIFSRRRKKIFTKAEMIYFQENLCAILVSEHFTKRISRVSRSKLKIRCEMFQFHKNRKIVFI